MVINYNVFSNIPFCQVSSSRRWRRNFFRGVMEWWSDGDENRFRGVKVSRSQGKRLIEKGN